MSRLHLKARQRHQLRKQLHTVPEARVYRRALAILEVARGRPLVHVAQSLSVSRQSLYNWVVRYQQNYDPAALRDHYRGGRPSSWTAQLQEVLTGSLAQPPEHWGYQAANWTVPLLIEHLVATRGHRLSDSTVRRQLRRLGYVWKRPRYVLSPDPEREKKTAPAPPARPAGRAQRRPV
jgi:transposase